MGKGGKGSVKVYKKDSDSVTLYMGETVQVTEDGQEYFELAPELEAIATSYTNLVWPK